MNRVALDAEAGTIWFTAPGMELNLGASARGTHSIACANYCGSAASRARSFPPAGDRGAGIFLGLQRVEQDLRVALPYVSMSLPGSCFSRAISLGTSPRIKRAPIAGRPGRQHPRDI
jgi:hypothetical protein